MTFYNDALGKDSIETIVTNIVRYPALKMLIGLAFAAASWLTNDQWDGILAVTLLIWIDTLTGVIKSVVAGDCSSRKFFRVLVKTFVYFTLITCSLLADKVIPHRVVSLTTLAFIGGTEVISVVENLNVLKFPVTNALLSRFKQMWDKLSTKKKENDHGR